MLLCSQSWTCVEQQKIKSPDRQILLGETDGFSCHTPQTSVPFHDLSGAMFTFLKVFFGVILQFKMTSRQELIVLLAVSSMLIYKVSTEAT